MDHKAFLDSRRDFLTKISLGASVVVPLITGCTQCDSTVSQNKNTTGLKPVDPVQKREFGLIDEQDSVAQALHYHHEKTQVSEDLQKMKNGKTFSEQFCHNCQFFVPIDEHVEKPVGRCLLLQAGNVKTQGWCASWVPKR